MSDRNPLAETAYPAPSQGAQRPEIECDPANGGGTLPEGQGELQRPAQNRRNNYNGLPATTTASPVRTMAVVGEAWAAPVRICGEVWIGDTAWIMCLWALKRYRALSRILARPALLPLARQAFAGLSAHRSKLSALFHLESDEMLRVRLDGMGSC